MSLPKDMRLQVVVRRNDLPEVCLVWVVSTRDKLKISDLVAQINDVVPLESADWALEDYVVDLPSDDGTPGFEFLHYQLLESVLKPDDKIAIRPLQADDLRRRRLSGRVQVNSNGKRLFDGVVFGRSRSSTRSDRPHVRIPPRKRQRLTYHDPDEITDDERPRLLLEDEPARLRAQEQERVGGQAPLSKEVVENSDDDSDFIRETVYRQKRDEADKRHKIKYLERELDRYASRASPNHSAKRQLELPGGIEMEDALARESSTSSASRASSAQREAVGGASRKSAPGEDKWSTVSVNGEDDDDDTSDSDVGRRDKISDKALSDKTSDGDKSDEGNNSQESPDDENSDDENSDDETPYVDTSPESPSGRLSRRSSSGRSSNDDSSDSSDDPSDASSDASVSDSDNDAPLPKSRAAPIMVATAANKGKQIKEAPVPIVKSQMAISQAPAGAASETRTLTRSQKRNLRRKLNKASRLEPASQAPQGFSHDIDHNDLMARKQALLSRLNSPSAQSQPGQAPVPDIPASGDHVREIPENWQSLINYNTAECAEDGPDIDPAPFPFQKWWHQEAGTAQHARPGKRKRDSYDDFDEDVTTAGHDRGDVDANSDGDVVLDYGDPEPTEPASTKDSDDLPSLPLNLDALPKATAGAIIPDTVITWKQLSLSSTYRPTVASITATVLAVEDEGARINVRLAKRDREGFHNKYDEDGSRIYGGLDAPDLDSDVEEDDGLRDLVVADLNDVRIVSAPAKLGATNMHDGEKADKGLDIASAAETTDTAAEATDTAAEATDTAAEATDTAAESAVTEAMPQPEMSVAMEVDGTGTVLGQPNAAQESTTTDTLMESPKEPQLDLADVASDSDASESAALGQPNEAQESTTTGTLMASPQEPQLELADEEGDASDSAASDSAASDSAASVRAASVRAASVRAASVRAASVRAASVRAASVSATGEAMQASTVAIDQTVDLEEDDDSDVPLSPPSMLWQEIQETEDASKTARNGDANMADANNEASYLATPRNTAQEGSQEMAFSTDAGQRQSSEPGSNSPSSRTSDVVAEALPEHDGETEWQPGFATPKAASRQRMPNSSPDDSTSDGETLPSLDEIFAASQRSCAKSVVSRANAEQTSENQESNSDGDTEYFDAESSRKNQLANKISDQHMLKPLAKASRAARSPAIAKALARGASTPAKKARPRASGPFVIPPGSKVITIMDDSPTSTTSPAVAQNVAANMTPKPASRRSARSTASSPLVTPSSKFMLQRQFILDEPMSISTDESIRRAIIHAFPRTPMSLFTFHLEGHPLPKKWLVQLHSEPVGACLKLEIATDNPERPWPAKLEQVKGLKCPFCEQRRHADPTECKWLTKDAYVSGTA